MTMAMEPRRKLSRDLIVNERPAVLLDDIKTFLQGRNRVRLSEFEDYQRKQRLLLSSKPKSDAPKLSTIHHEEVTKYQEQKVSSIEKSAKKPPLVENHEKITKYQEPKVSSIEKSVEKPPLVEKHEKVTKYQEPKVSSIEKSAKKPPLVENHDSFLINIDSNLNVNRKKRPASVILSTTKTSPKKMKEDYQETANIIIIDNIEPSLDSDSDLNITDIDEPVNCISTLKMSSPKKIQEDDEIETTANVIIDNTEPSLHSNSNLNITDIDEPVDCISNVEMISPKKIQEEEEKDEKETAANNILNTIEPPRDINSNNVNIANNNQPVDFISHTNMIDPKEIEEEHENIIIENNPRCNNNKELNFPTVYLIEKKKEDGIFYLTSQEGNRLQLTRYNGHTFDFL